jgi:hypothetical protein
MDEEERLLYNQRAALALAEKYVFLEERILVPALEGLATSRAVHLDQEVASEIEIFCEEERKHAEAFWRLCETAAPELYPAREFRYLASGRAGRAFLAANAAAPAALTAWVWIALYFEEMTVRISRHYARDGRTCPLFRRVHDAHMREEVGHVALDRFFLSTFFASRSSLEKHAAFALFGAVMNRFATPLATPLAIFADMERALPRVARLRADVERELPLLAHVESFQAELFSPRSSPLTYAHLRSYPESSTFFRFAPSLAARETSGRAPAAGATP